MIGLSDTVAGMLAGHSFTVHHRLQSWFNGRVIAEDIPAVDVVEEADDSIRVPERLTFNVPATDDNGYSWVPIDFDSPLGVYGQRVVAQVGVSVGDTVEWLDRGTFLLYGASSAGEQIAVECVGLTQLLEEAQLATEYQPKTGATFKSALRALIEPGITIDFTNAPTDRTLPEKTISWSDNRLDDVHDILDAWPADGVMTNLGHMEVRAVKDWPTVGESVFAFTEGVDGTALEYSTSISREGAFNAVVAKGAYPDTAGSKAGQEIIFTHRDNAASSPYRYGGPFSPYMVPFGYASPLMTTPGQVAAAAQTRLLRLRTGVTSTAQITAAPHYGLQLGDAVLVTSARLSLSAAVGRVAAVQLPYTATGGSMGLTVRFKGYL